jgi:hypothetical protein
VSLKGRFFVFLVPLSMQIVKKEQIAENPVILHKFKKPARMEIFGVGRGDVSGKRGRMVALNLATQLSFLLFF